MVEAAIDSPQTHGQQRCVLADNIDQTFTRCISFGNLDLFEDLRQVAGVDDETTIIIGHDRSSKVGCKRGKNASPDEPIVMTLSNYRKDTAPYARRRTRVRPRSVKPLRLWSSRRTVFAADGEVMLH